MALPSVAALGQLARARLHAAAWSVAIGALLAATGLAALGLGLAAGVIETAGRIGLVPALLAWSGGLAAVVLAGIGVRLVAGRRRRLRELERAATAPAGKIGGALLSDAGFNAGIKAGQSLSPVAALAAAFVVGTLIARTGRR